MHKHSLEETFLNSLLSMNGKPALPINAITIESMLVETPVGNVYLGTHTGLGVPVVVRVLHPCARAQMESFENFKQQIRLMGQIRHTNLACVFDVGDHEGHAYLVLEYVAGVPLSERMDNRPMAEAQALKLLLPIAEALCEMWRRNVLHRSVSPRFIYVAADGTPKMDFGTSSEQVLKEATEEGVGPYWSPEMIRNDPVIDARSDMWSFGATLYHMVTGSLPFPGERISDIHLRVLTKPPVDPKTANPGLHDAMRSLLLQLLEKEPAKRFPTPEKFLTALRSVDHQISHASIHEPTVVLSDSKAPAGPFSRLKLGVGDVLGHCLLEKEVGSGAFGVVYLARHTVLDIPVAVKILPKDLAQRDPSYISLFLREARTAARIRHTNVIGIFEAGNQDGQHYLIMEYAPGGTVLDRMEQLGGRLPVTEGAKILLHAARGLAAAEALQIVHRDIKPENLMFGAHGELKIADMGLAKRLLPAQGSIRESLVADQLSMNKGSNDIVGTPAYMAPEIALTPEKVDTRADLYSLGCTAYHMLTGELPFTGKTSIETIMKHVHDAPTPPRFYVGTIPHDLQDVVMKLMAKNPDERYQGAAELEAALLQLPILQSAHGLAMAR